MIALAQDGDAAYRDRYELVWPGPPPHRANDHAEHDESVPLFGDQTLDRIGLRAALESCATVTQKKKFLTAYVLAIVLILIRFWL